MHLLDTCFQRTLDKKHFPNMKIKWTESKWSKSQWKSPKVSEHVPVLYSQDPPHYSTLNFFHRKKKLFLHVKCRPLTTQPQSNPKGSTTPLRKRVSRSGALVTKGRFPGRYSEIPSHLQSKSQEPGPEFSLWVIQMESLEAADCSSVPLMCLMMLDKRLNLSFSISEQRQWQLIHTF